MNKKDFSIRDILVHERILNDDLSLKEVKKWQQIPQHMIEHNMFWDYEEGTDSGDGCAHAYGYRFEHFKALDYLVVELNACEAFTFERWYPINPGFNEELFNMLEAVRAFRFHDGKFDVSRLLCHDFCFRIKKYPNTDTYRIYDVIPEPMSYEFNICCYYEKNKIVSELMEQMDR